MGNTIKPNKLLLEKASAAIMKKMTEKEFNDCLSKWNVEAKDNKALIRANTALLESKQIKIDDILKKNANLVEISNNLNVELKIIQSLLKLKL